MKLPSVMYASTVKLFTAILLISMLFSCDTETEELELEKPQDYIIPLQVGKSITYKLDSTVFTQAGRAVETHSYQEKNVVDAQITDNNGRTAYRIYRYLRNATGTSSWIPAGTYTITPLDNKIEVTDNNLRVIALSAPIKEGYQWKGNSYLGPEPYSSLYTFSKDDNMNDWDFVIESVGLTETFNNTSIENVITISHADESDNEIDGKPINTTLYAARVFSLDKYAKGIGLVYQEHILWEFQPNPGSSSYSTGFGIKRTLLEHN